MLGDHTINRKIKTKEWWSLIIKFITNKAKNPYTIKNKT
jgi:hypothetical protein